MCQRCLRGGVAAAGAAAERASRKLLASSELKSHRRGARGPPGRRARGAGRAARLRDRPVAVTAVTASGAAPAAGRLGALRRPNDLRQRGKQGGVSRRRPGREARASAGGSAVSSRRATGVHVATRMHTRLFSCAARTSCERPWRTPERPLVAAVAAVMAPGMWAVGPMLSIGAAPRIEMPASAERASVVSSHMQDGPIGHELEP